MPRPPAGSLLLLVSDLHLGRGTAAATRAAERDAVAMLRAHRARLVGGGALVLLGDVFDQYIEYRHLMPKTAPRLVGAVAELADDGAEVVYTRGNRDPWHLDLFGTLGVRVVDEWRTRRDGRALYIAHGDGHGTPGSLTERLAHRLTPLFRAPFMARLYRMALPGDAGFALARWTARTFGTDGAPDAGDARRLAEAARRRLRDTDADVVAFGHSHAAALDDGPGGLYLNPGYWFADRTFATLDADGPALLRWRDGRAHRIRPRAAAGAAAAAIL